MNIEYDIDMLKDFDINLGTLGEVTIEGYEGEKLIIQLSSLLIRTCRRILR